MFPIPSDKGEFSTIDVFNLVYSTATWVPRFPTEKESSPQQGVVSLPPKPHTIAPNPSVRNFVMRTFLREYDFQRYNLGGLRKVGVGVGIGVGGLKNASDVHMALTWGKGQHF